MKSWLCFRAGCNQTVVLGQHGVASGARNCAFKMWLEVIIQDLTREIESFRCLQVLSFQVCKAPAPQTPGELCGSLFGDSESAAW